MDPFKFAKKSQVSLTETSAFNPIFFESNFSFLSEHLSKRKEFWVALFSQQL